LGRSSGSMSTDGAYRAIWLTQLVVGQDMTELKVRSVRARDSALGTALPPDGGLCDDPESSNITTAAIVALSRRLLVSFHG